MFVHELFSGTHRRSEIRQLFSRWPADDHGLRRQVRKDVDHKQAQVKAAENLSRILKYIEDLIKKILNLYFILVCTHLYHFFAALPAMHSLLITLYVTEYLIGINQRLI